MIKVVRDDTEYQGLMESIKNNENYKNYPLIIFARLCENRPRLCESRSKKEHIRDISDRVSEVIVTKERELIGYNVFACIIESETIDLYDLNRLDDRMKSRFGDSHIFIMSR